MAVKLGVARGPLRPECVYLALREVAVLAGVSTNWVERRVADGELEVWLVERRGRGGRRHHLYRLDEVLALKGPNRR